MKAQGRKELENLIMNPGLHDVNGLSDLDRRADFYRNSRAMQDRIVEMQTVLDILNQIAEYDASNITRLFEYARRAGLNSKQLAQDSISLLENGNVKLNIYQKEELIRCVLREAPELVKPDTINIGLAYLKTNDPWTFAALYAPVDKDYYVFDFVIYKLKEGFMPDISALTELILIWTEKSDPKLFRRLSLELLPLILNYEDVKAILEFKLKQLVAVNAELDLNSQIHESKDFKNSPHLSTFSDKLPIISPSHVLM